ncbi:MAG: VWA domain-containing protein [Bacteroidetes bacterium]|nr:VWA domain-containing protein [Bacteroidota bacterium]
MKYRRQLFNKSLLFTGFSMFLYVLLAQPAVVIAQPDLNFKRIRLDWPYVELFFSVGCDGVTDYSIRPTDIRLYEDGRQVTDFGMNCPDPTSRCPISVALVFDASDSMAGEANEGAKHGGATFIGNMDNVIDEACVVHFNQSVWVFQHMTTDTTRLRSAVSRLPASGATALWDAVFTALAVVQNNGTNECRAVIVLSDGIDNSSVRHGLPDIIEFAVRNNIRVFPIGYGDNISEDELIRLAELTGGVYYHTPDASKLASIYEEIATIIYDFFQECVLWYDPRCGDFQEHEVELAVEDLCNGDATMTRYYNAPIDSSTFTVKDFALDTVNGMGGAEIRMPILATTPFINETLYPMNIRLRFDRSRLELLRVETPVHTLLEGINVHIADLGDGGNLRIPRRSVLNAGGTLCNAVFKTTKHVADAEYPIEVVSAGFEQGCITPRFSDGLLRVEASRPLLNCDLLLPERAEWDAARLRYNPEPLAVRLNLVNSGTIPAVNGTVRLEYNSAVFSLLAPSEAIQSIDTLHALGQASMQWELTIKPQAGASRQDLCLRIAFEGLEEELCCASVDVEAAGMLLHCGLDLPAMRYSDVMKAFQPNPFDLDLRVDNAGVVPSGSLRASLQLPEGLYIESGDQYEKTLNPASLDPAMSATVSWRLRLISPLGGERLPIRIELRNDGALYRSCEDTLVVPWVTPEFDADITVNGPASFCDGDSVQLDAGAEYVNYKWNTGHSGRILTVRKNGLFFAAVRDAQGVVGHTRPIRVTVYPLPEQPVIRRDRNTLIVTTTHRVQWYRNGVLLAGSTAKQLGLDSTGSYTVRVITDAGCINGSDPFVVMLLDTGPLAAAASPSLTVYPQPAQSRLSVSLSGIEEGKPLTMRVFNLLGKTVLLRRIDAYANASPIILDVSAMRPGMYLLVVSGPDSMLTRKFLRK